MTFPELLVFKVQRIVDNQQKSIFGEKMKITETLDLEDYKQEEITATNSFSLNSMVNMSGTTLKDCSYQSVIKKSSNLWRLEDAKGSKNCDTNYVLKKCSPYLMFFTRNHKDSEDQ